MAIDFVPNSEPGRNSLKGAAFTFVAEDRAHHGPRNIKPRLPATSILDSWPNQLPNCACPVCPICVSVSERRLRRIFVRESFFATACCRRRRHPEEATPACSTFRRLLFSSLAPSMHWKAALGPILLAWEDLDNDRATCQGVAVATANEFDHPSKKRAAC